MGIDDARQDAKPLSLDDFGPLGNLLSFNGSGNVHDLRILDQDVSMPGPLRINKKSVLNQ
ncbi:hypothetical protein SDC9_163592 [bioreactor metagenome]|uniref:Uncharacterized protein n=1 Tax=bioreactor metagenome TaxID=1076179 RepID=A0A645FW47_9ZZZZ